MGYTITELHNATQYRKRKAPIKDYAVVVLIMIVCNIEPLAASSCGDTNTYHRRVGLSEREYTKPENTTHIPD